MPLFESFRELCLSRKSIRNFSSKPLSDDIVSKILELAYSAPYASGKKNSWEIMVVRERKSIEQIADAVRKKSAAIAERVKADYREAFQKYAENFVIFEQAPVLFIPCYRLTPSLSLMLSNPEQELLDWEKENQHKSISSVALIIHQAAHSLGLASCYLTGALLAEKEIAAIIKPKPERKIGALIPVGTSI